MIDTNKYRVLLNKITPKYTSATFLVDKCPVPLIGKSIKSHLNGCKSVLVYAATFGEEFDRLLRQIQLTDMAGAVILDSLAGEELERFCDVKNGDFGFSPGYGDFPLSVNRNIITVLNASTKIGLCLTESLMMTPQKSITGIVGIRNENHEI
jgi:5-methyltetrahydrofolate--homocysteine methyltransferase